MNSPKQVPEIENIELMELLGQGGMSLVFKARQKQLDRIVAVKVMSSSSNEESIKRFKNEAMLTSTLEHPNIVKIISFGVSSDGKPYLVMEYLEGQSLYQDLKLNGRLNLLKFKEVFLPALSALGHAHSKGVIHRDIKPGNIMICRNDGGRETVKVVDFGIAKIYDANTSEDQNLTKTGQLIGTPSYMSPEQCAGKELDARSDLYSMACVMYETLSGEPPFSGQSALNVMQKHLMQAPPSVSDLSRRIDIRKELAKATLWGLEKEPDLRPQSAFDFAKILNQVLERITLDKVPQLRSSSGSRAKSIGMSAAVFIAILILFIVLQLRDKVVVKSPSAQNSAEAQIKSECKECFEKGLQLVEQNKINEAVSFLTKAMELAEPNRGFYRLSQQQSLQAVHTLALALQYRKSLKPENSSDTKLIQYLIAKLQLVEALAKKGYNSDYSETLGALSYLSRYEKCLDQALKLDTRLVNYELEMNNGKNTSKLLVALQGQALDHAQLRNYSEALKSIKGMDSKIATLEPGNPYVIIGKHKISEVYLTLYSQSNEKQYWKKRLELLKYIAKMNSEFNEASKYCTEARQELKEALSKKSASTREK